MFTFSFIYQWLTARQERSFILRAITTMHNNTSNMLILKGAFTIITIPFIASARRASHMGATAAFDRWKKHLLKFFITNFILKSVPKPKTSIRWMWCRGATLGLRSADHRMKLFFNFKPHCFREMRQPLNNIQNMPPHGVPPQQQQQQIQQQPPAGGGGGVGLPPPPKAMRGQPMPQHMQGSFDGQQQHPHPPHLIIQVTIRFSPQAEQFF